MRRANARLFFACGPRSMKEGLLIAVWEVNLHNRITCRLTCQKTGCPVFQVFYFKNNNKKIWRLKNFYYL
jgi:hypothetical protein